MKKAVRTTTYLLLVSILAFASVGQAANSKTGTTAFPFLKINPGARAVAMGGAFTGLANDEMAAYYNPAGLAALEGKRFIAEYQSYIADINSGMVGVVLPVSYDRAFAFHISYLNYGDFIQTDQAGNITGEFGGSDMLFGVSYSMRIKPTILIGATGKFIYESIQDYSASGAALDLGAKYISDRDRYHAGFMIQNLGTQLSSLGEEKDALPLTFRAGGAFYPRGYAMVVSLDIVAPIDNDPFIAIGTESFKFNPVYLRLGWNSFGTNYKAETSDDNWAGLSVGFGIDLWTTQLSYAFTPAADLGEMHRITWQGRFK